METTQKNLEWQIKPEVKLGNYGENLVFDFLKRKGYVIYTPRTSSGAHAVDADVYKDKIFKFHLEVKTKPKCSKYPETGIDYRLYDVYKKLPFDTFLAFVDYHEGKIYGNFLSELTKPCNYCGYDYPKTRTKKGGVGSLIYFPICKMKILKYLTEKEIRDLNNLAAGDYSDD